MQMTELIQEIMKHANEYASESYETIYTGEMQQARTHKKKRINKKWKARYGMKPVSVKKKCKKIDVTPQLILDFCQKYNMPLPTDLSVYLGCETESE